MTGMADTGVFLSRSPFCEGLVAPSFGSAIPSGTALAAEGNLTGNHALS